MVQTRMMTTSREDERPVRGGRRDGRGVLHLDPQGQALRLDLGRRGPAHAHANSAVLDDLNPVRDQPAGGVVGVVQVGSGGAFHGGQPDGLQGAEGGAVALDAGEGSGFGAPGLGEHYPGGGGRGESDGKGRPAEGSRGLGRGFGRGFGRGLHGGCSFGVDGLRCRSNGAPDLGNATRDGKSWPVAARRGVTRSGAARTTRVSADRRRSGTALAAWRSASDLSVTRRRCGRARQRGRYARSRAG